MVQTQLEEAVVEGRGQDDVLAGRRLSMTSRDGLDLDRVERSPERDGGDEEVGGGPPGHIQTAPQVGAHVEAHDPDRGGSSDWITALASASRPPPAPRRRRSAARSREASRSRVGTLARGW